MSGYRTVLIAICLLARSGDLALAAGATSGPACRAELQRIAARILAQEVKQHELPYGSPIKCRILKWQVRQQDGIIRRAESSPDHCAVSDSGLAQLVSDQQRLRAVVETECGPE